MHRRPRGDGRDGQARRGQPPQLHTEFDYAADTRGWEAWPANIGMGLFVRGEGVLPGPMSNMSSPRCFGGWGAGSSCLWVDAALDLCFALLSTGPMAETYHIERLQRLADLVVTSLSD